MIAMLAGPLVARFGWQSLWYTTGLLSLAYSVVAWFAAPLAPKAALSGERALRDFARIMRAPGTILLSLAFGFYSLQYHALSGLLPSLLVERLEVSIAEAGGISAASIVASGLGAVTAGFLLRQGVPLWAIIASAFGFMGLVTFGIFQASMPLLGVAALGIASLGATGFVPASIYAAAPKFALTRRCSHSQSDAWCRPVIWGTSSAPPHSALWSSIWDGPAHPLCSLQLLAPAWR